MSNESKTTCTGDSCDVSYTLRRAVESMDEAAKDKLRRWINSMDPMDYDAPGTSARETGV